MISGVEGFMGYYVVYAPDDTVIAISLFSNYAAAEESNKRALAWIEHDLAPLLTGAGNGGGRAGDRAHAGVTSRRPDQRRFRICGSVFERKPVPHLMSDGYRFA